MAGVTRFCELAGGNVGLRRSCQISFDLSVKASKSAKEGGGVEGATVTDDIAPIHDRTFAHEGFARPPIRSEARESIVLRNVERQRPRASEAGIAATQPIGSFAAEAGRSSGLRDGLPRTERG